MLEYIGKYNKAAILLDACEGNVISQTYSILNNPAFEKSNIAIMPDCHIGSGVMVGFTMTLNDYIVPSVIGVDIGCGVSTYNIGRLKAVKCEKLDKFIRNYIPSGAAVNEEPIVEPEFVEKVINKLGLDYGHVMRSLGSLGGGNHFIELDKDDDQNIWLTIHTGSRNFGLQVAKYHEAVAEKNMKAIYQGSAYKGLQYLSIDKEGKDYIEDMAVAQKYAALNRELIAKLIIEKFFKLQTSTVDKIESVHNYIDFKDNIVRKGAISAHEGERLIVPFNMAYGCAIGIGKSPEKYNYSAPHGAGRIMNRGEAKYKVTLEAYEKAMKGIYTTSVSKKTIDESPMAYKKPKLILENITELLEIDRFIKPMYNFKAE